MELRKWVPAKADIHPGSLASLRRPVECIDIAFEPDWVYICLWNVPHDDCVLSEILKAVSTGHEVYNTKPSNYTSRPAFIQTNVDTWYFTSIS